MTQAIRIICAFVYIIFLSCCGRENYTGTFETLATPGEAEEFTQIQETSVLPAPVDESTLPKVSIPRDYRLIDLRTENLDLDRSDEQILLLRKNNEDSVELWIVDYDDIKSIYFVSYKSTLPAGLMRRFQVSSEDIIGDHIPEILITGTDPEGTQSLDVYRKNTHPSGIGLYYTGIFSHEISGTIEIMRKTRDQAYREGLSNGKSFSIETYVQDVSSPDFNDLIRSSYFFRYQTNSYVLVDKEKITGDKVDEERLKILYTKGVSEFEAYLAGPWFRTDRDNPTEEPILLFFDKEGRRVQYFESGSQEVLIWGTSTKPLYNRLVISGFNELIPDLVSRILTIQTINIDSVTVYGPDPFRGTYSRFSEGLQRKHFSVGDSGYIKPELSGIFNSSEGEILKLANNRFILHENGKELSGGYAMYLKGNPIITLKVISERGILMENRVYKYDFFEEVRENRIIRTLVLFPGKMSVQGFVHSGDSASRFQQIEMIEQDKNIPQG